MIREWCDACSGTGEVDTDEGPDHCYACDGTGTVPLGTFANQVARTVAAILATREEN